MSLKELSIPKKDASLIKGGVEDEGSGSCGGVWDCTSLSCDDMNPLVNGDSANSNLTVVFAPIEAKKDSLK